MKLAAAALLALLTVSCAPLHVYRAPQGWSSAGEIVDVLLPPARAQRLMRVLQGDPKLGAPGESVFSNLLYDYPGPPRAKLNVPCSRSAPVVPRGVTISLQVRSTDRNQAFARAKELDALVRSQAAALGAAPSAIVVTSASINSF